MIEADLELDLKGMNCPLPLLKTKQTMSQMSSGQVIRVQTTDPGSVRDFASYARIVGHTLVSSETVGGVFIHVLRHK
ncbi:sulfurtransferase TusA family protein [Endozoicomonas sp. Mp262]|uniref:sulfurtransferase TusA family protein n=1 Tax=Endozoicomonas sp. Mp262 TaxID=2919499 RepID=UPI0021D90206